MSVSGRSGLVVRTNGVSDRGASSSLTAAERPTLVFEHTELEGTVGLFGVHRLLGGGCFFLSDLLAPLGVAALLRGRIPLLFLSSGGPRASGVGSVGAVGRSQVVRFLLYWNVCPVDNLWVTCVSLWITCG